jgi:hypothetical protein
MCNMLSYLKVLHEMDAFKQISYRIEIGDSAVAVIRKYHNKVELAICDSDDYVVHLNANQ